MSSSNQTRYAIHMETGVVIPMTAETVNNYLYQEIEPEVAFMVDRGELDPKYVIGEIERQLPKTTLRDKVKLVAKLNVRQSDFGLAEAARAGVDLGESRVVKISLPQKGQPGAKDTPPGAGNQEGKPKPKVNV